MSAPVYKEEEGGSMKNSPTTIALRLESYLLHILRLLPK